jgi:hypothetical protein
MIVAFSVTVESPYLWAQSRRNTNPTQTGPSTTTTVNNGQTTTTITTTQTTSTSPGLNSLNPTLVNTTTQNNQIANQQNNLGGNVKNQGSNASGAQMLGMLAGLAGAAFSGYKAAQAAATCPKGPECPMTPLWILGALASAAVAMAMGKAKNKSDNTVADVTGGNLGGTGTNTTTTDVTQTPEYKETERNLQAAASKIPGMSVNMRTGTLKFPNGKEIKASDLGNKQAMAAAGMSGDEIAGFEAAFKQAMKEGEKKAKSKGIDANQGNEGEIAGGAGGSSRAMTSSNDNPGYGGMAANAVNRDPAQVAGLSKNFNGEPIGVASENLFTLINRRYDHKAQHDTFIIPGAPKRAQ